MREGWDPSFGNSPCGGEVMDSRLLGPKAIPMATEVRRPSRPPQESFALADDGIREREAAGATTPSRR